jgi:hypothetical protein
VLTEPGAPMLPAKFGEWQRTVLMDRVTPGYSLANTNQDALKECGLERSEVADYESGGRRLHLEADGFGDRTGATSAYSLVKQAGASVGRELGAEDAVGNQAVLVTIGTSVVLANFSGPISAGDVASLKPLVLRLPKVVGSRGVAPLLPTLVPAKGLVAGSVRYALGPATYAGEGGVLPAKSLGWDKSAEAVTAVYSDKRGKETLTVLMYPTPAIAAGVAKVIADEMPQMGPDFVGAKVRHEGPLVMLAAGSFAVNDAQGMVDGVHLRELVATDGDMHPLFKTEGMKTYSLLANIAILAGVMMLAAVLLGLFLGVGRATFRVMRGKSAAVEPEFLSLHLAPQNKAPEFEGAKE